MSEPVLVVTGEVSGDMHAAAVMHALRARRPEVAAFGVGGDRLAETGMDLLVHVRDMAVFGPFAALLRLAHFRKVFNQVLQAARERGAKTALLVDYGGFNLRLAKALRAAGVKVLYFISPQVWASRPGRIQVMAERIDRLMVIFPFEPAIFEGSGLRVDYVGHPLVDAVAAHCRQPVADLSWPAHVKVALLPGSRNQEVDLILPVMLEAAGILAGMAPGCGFLVAAPDDRLADRARVMVEERSNPLVPVEVVSGQTREVLRQARAGWVASGTATVEAALLDCPLAVVYRTSPWMYALARRIMTIDRIGMVNLVADATICEELIQDGATPRALADVILPLLGDTIERGQMLEAYARVRERLGSGGAADRAAAIIAEVMEEPGVPAG